MPKKIILTKGLPASGKSTWAKKMLDDNPGQYKRVNKDDLRAMLDNSKWSKTNESFVKDVRNYIVKTALTRGFSVIVDDTNLDDSHLHAMESIAEDFNVLYPDEVHVEVKDFTDVPLDECIKRDSLRSGTAHVGEKVIRGMYNQFLKKEPAPPYIDPFLPWAVICDLDGTLALHDGRSPYDLDKVLTDKINKPVLDILTQYDENSNHKIIFCSGREDKCREATEKWLGTTNLTYEALLMRKTGDMRNDAIVKQEIYDTHIKGKYNILFVLDDRDRVVEMWRNNGLTCLQVNYGSF